jgi:hypothetical protein
MYILIITEEEEEEEEEEVKIIRQYELLSQRHSHPYLHLSTINYKFDLATITKQNKCIMTT